MAFQFLTHAGQAWISNTSSTEATGDKLGWSKSGSGNTTLFLVGLGSSYSTPANTMGATPGNISTNVAVITRISGGTTGNDRFTRPVTDNNKLSLTAAMRLTSRYNQNQTWLSFAGSNRISVGLSGKVAAIYIDDVLTQTSTVDVVTGAPWFHVELLIDKTTSTITMYINGTSAATATTPGGLTINAAQMDLGINQYFVQYQFIQVWDNTGQIGAQQVESYTKTGNNTLGFTGSDIVSTMPFNPASYRTSATAGAQDLYTYTGVFPADVNVGTINGICLSVVASSDGVVQGTLNQRLKISSTNYDTSVSSLLTNTTPVITQIFTANDPSTSTAWTKSGLQALLAGYVIAA